MSFKEKNPEKKIANSFFFSSPSVCFARLSLHCTLLPQLCSLDTPSVLILLLSLIFNLYLITYFIQKVLVQICKIISHDSILFINKINHNKIYNILKFKKLYLITCFIQKVLVQICKIISHNSILFLYKINYNKVYNFFRFFNKMND
jgi:hypothetical protein